eukprot:TRINITY_DN248_c0_g1_i2.p1 TRINITY_DN248_c0_g1~~TRINITY_DN248_c0_g1_i2.p1  ORF type:complete len:477 (+),score=133.57 TRINITY_DN248_c0_g1_i2:84-1514(+)
MQTARQAPGGTSSLSLGEASAEMKPVSSNAYACGYNQNCGNVLTDRPSTALHAPPGGKSTICLGTEDSKAMASESSNAFAHGSHQNSGNVLTERPSTSLHAPPGGKSTICLASDGFNGASAPVSSNAYACGANQNSGNVLTERPSTGLHAPPGGNTTICLGTDADEWKACSAALADHGSTIAAAAAEPSPRVPVGGEDHVQFGAGPVSSDAVPSTRMSPGGEDHIAFGSSEQFQPTGNYAPPGGSTTICLGADAGDWNASSKALADHGSTIAAAAAEPSPRVPVGGEDHVQFGAGPVSSDAVPSTRMSPGGEDHIAFGSSEQFQSTGNYAPPGGSTTICLGRDAGEWKASSKALPDHGSTIAAAAAEPSPRVPVGGQDHIDFKAKDSAKVSGGLPVGGVDHVVLGTDKAVEFVRKVDTEAAETKAAAGDVLAASKRPLQFGEEPDMEVKSHQEPCPTPARNVTRAPPGGATSVMLG